MKIFKIWAIIILSTTLFMTLLVNTANISEQKDLKLHSDMVYYNGYLNFVFNGFTKMLVSNNKENYSNYNEDIPADIYNNKTISDTPKREGQFIVPKGLEEGLNNTLRKILGYSLDDMVRTIERLPQK